MNFVYKKDSLRPLEPAELAAIANDASPFRPFTVDDFDGENSRVQKLNCKCNGFGEFELIAPQKGEYRRFVKCRECGTIVPL